MAKQITFEYQDNKYTLEYTRDTVKAIERQGFRINDIDTMPMTMISLFVHGAFYAHHPELKDEVMDSIYEAMPNKDEFLMKLMEMYSDTVNTLRLDPAKAVKNVVWTPNW